MRLLSRLFFVVVSMSFLIGCGGGETNPQGTLTGTLSVDGKPHGGVDLIVLSAKSGKGASTTVKPDGTFSFDKSFDAGDYTAYLAPAAVQSEGTESSATMDSSIADQYWGENSPLKVTIGEGKNTKELKITK